MVEWTSYWGAIGVAELLVIGAVLFFFPEPATSFVGMVLILVAAIAWLAGWYGTRDQRTGREETDADRTY